jgi:hypothetical protein
MLAKKTNNSLEQASVKAERWNGFISKIVLYGKNHWVRVAKKYIWIADRFAILTTELNVCVPPQTTIISIIYKNRSDREKLRY